MTAQREIIDGQQRLKTIFDFLNDGFRISKVHNQEYGNKTYSSLPEEVQMDFLKYPISAILLIDLSDTDVFDMFARLNTYSVKLNPQELLNSQFFGVYKKLVYKLAREYHNFWIDSKILSEKNISRMDDAKLVSDLLSVIVQNKIETNNYTKSKKLYDKYDDEFENSEIIEHNFKYTLDLFSKVYEQNFAETSFNKSPLFYSTFLVLYHMNYPLTIFATPVSDIKEKDLSKVKTVLDDIDMIVSNQKQDELNKEDRDFVATLKNHTTTPEVRLLRCKYIVAKLNEAFR